MVPNDEVETIDSVPQAAAEAPVAAEKESETEREFQPDLDAVARALDGLASGGYIWGVGRRKTAVARVRLKKGTGKITVNDRTFQEFFPRERDRIDVYAPLQLARCVNKVDVLVRVAGGGTTGQAGAVRLGVARALSGLQDQFTEPLRNRGFLTRDSRKKERKKYGRRGARRSFQFSKR